jgi:hypothetical protein
MKFSKACRTNRIHRKTKKSFLLFFLSFSVFSVCSVGHLLLAVSGQFLLMEPIGESLETGDFTRFHDVSEEKISINFGPPFDLKGYVPIDKFIDDFSSVFSRYQATRTEWTSKQIEENFAVQSLNVILKDKRSEKDIYYKFIFFMKKRAEWKIYYLRGLKL